MGDLSEFRNKKTAKFLSKVIEGSKFRFQPTLVLKANEGSF